ncbi:MAG: hypothetical protein II738_03250 [Clostridia bacterium]|nr:hypothetical protein [Clostridia bacterium]
MKKTIALLTAVVLLASLCACGAAPRVDGEYADLNGDARYTFTRTDDGKGEYGGTCRFTRDGKNESTAGWYVENGTVYVGGEAVFLCKGEYLAFIDSRCDGVTVNNRTLTGKTVPANDSDSGLASLLNGLILTFHGDGTCEAESDVALIFSNTYKGTYKVEGAAVTLTFPEKDTLDRTCLIVDGALYYNGLKQAESAA